MKDRSQFGIAALWENWKDPTTAEWVRTFVILTTPSNDLVTASTTGCRRSSNPPSTSDGLGSSRTPTIFWSHSQAS